MNINYNPDNKSFKAIKIVKCSNAEFEHLTQNFGKTLNNGRYLYFKNRSVSDYNSWNTLEQTAENMNMSKEWLYANCKRHNIMLPNPDAQPLYVFSDKDIIHLMFYKLKDLFREIRDVFINSGKAVNLPHHLQTLKILNEHAEKTLPDFKNFLKKHNAQEINLTDFIQELKNIHIGDK